MKLTLPCLVRLKFRGVAVPRAFLAMLLFAGLPASVSASTAPMVPEVAGPDFKNRLSRSVLKIQNYSQDYDYHSPWNSREVETSYGTGFYIGRGRIVTNAHVVAQSRLLRVQKNNGTKWFPARVRHIAHDCDLAIIEVKDSSFYQGLPVLKIQNKLPRLNDQVAVYGYPVGGDRISVTIGVVSRIEMQEYAHSGVDAHLALQVDAAINPGNSGGPVLMGQDVIGVAFQSFTNAENTGYVIPAEVIRHFLTDISDGFYHGYPDIGLTTMDLVHDATRFAHGLKKNETGVAIVRVIPGGSGDGLLKPGQVLLEINGQSIANDGTIPGRYGQRVNYADVAEQLQIGQTLRLKIREGEKVFTVNMKLRGLPILDFQRNHFEKKPRYFLRAGLLFQPLHRNVLQSGSRLWGDVTNSTHGYIFNYFLADHLYRNRRKLVVLYRVLPDPINSWYGGLAGHIVDTFNGTPVRDLAHLAELWKKNTRPWVEIRFFFQSYPLVLKTKQLAAAEKRIRRRYDVGRRENLK